MKKILSIIMILVLAMGMMTACGSKEEEDNMANPVHECTAEELAETTGIPMAAPEGAKDVQYAYIEGDNVIGQVTYTLDGVNYCYRAAWTNATDILATVDGEVAEGEGIMNAFKDGTSIITSQAGVYEEWTDGGGQELYPGVDGFCVFTEEGVGVVGWLDVVPGALYTLSMDSDATKGSLLNAAGMLYTPLQGEA